MQENIGFTEGKILSPLIRFALPVLLALFLQAMYGAVDLLVVGQDVYKRQPQGTARLLASLCLIKRPL